MAASDCAAQENAKDIKREGLSAYENGRFPNAAELLSKYRKIKPNDRDIWYPLAVSSYKIDDLAAARMLFEGILRAGKAPDDAYLYLGRIEHYENNFSAAAKNYKKYLATVGPKDPLYHSIVDDIRRAGVGDRMGKSTGAIAAYSENLGPGVNSPEDDFHPILSPNYQDRMYFASTREGATGGRRNEKGLPDEKKGSHRSDMYSAQIENGRWSDAHAMSSLLNSIENEVALDFSMGGQVLVYFRGKSLFSGDIVVDTFKRDVEDRKLYSPVWTNGPLNAAQGDNDLFFFNDTTVLFSSQRNDGYGGFDLYYSTKRNGRWLPPTNLGPEVNSAYDERSPFLAADGRALYFSSNRVDLSIGGFDIFKSTFDDRMASWTTPENGGLSVNTAGNELNFRLSLSGLEGYYDSDTHGSGYGMRDIYVAYFKEQPREQTVTSRPAIFIDVLATVQRNALAAALPGQPEPEAETLASALKNRVPVTVKLQPLLYGANDNIETPGNLEKSRSVLQFLEQYPGSHIVVTSHADDSDPERFRTYFGIKRAEKFAEYLIKRGISKDRIQLMSVGSLYPLAFNEYNGQPSIQGQKFNRRLELHLIPGPDYILNPSYEDPRVPDFLALDLFEVYRNLQSGPVFRIEVASLGQMFDDDLWHQLPLPTIQSNAGSELYKYEVGAYVSFASAQQLKEEALRKGLLEAKIVAYLDGKRLSNAEVARFAPLYPELAAFVASLEPATE